MEKIMKQVRMSGEIGVRLRLGIEGDRRAGDAESLQGGHGGMGARACRRRGPIVSLGVRDDGCVAGGVGAEVRCGRGVFALSRAGPGEDGIVGRKPLSSALFAKKAIERSLALRARVLGKKQGEALGAAGG